MKRSTRRAAVLGLCGAFAVVPVLGLVHHQSSPARVALSAEPGPPPAAPGPDVRVFSDRVSRSDFRIVEVVDSQVAPDPSTTIDPPTLTTPTTRAPLPVRRVATTPTTRPRPTTTTTSRPAHAETGGASWYDAPAGTCANNDAPMGAVVTVTDLATGRSVTCQVTSRGPFYNGRIIDLARTTFDQLAPAATGVIQVRVSW